MLVIALKYAAPSGYIIHEDRVKNWNNFLSSPVIKGLVSSMCRRKEKKNMGKKMLSCYSLCLECPTPTHKYAELASWNHSNLFSNVIFSVRPSTKRKITTLPPPLALSAVLDLFYSIAHIYFNKLHNILAEILLFLFYGI